MPYPTNVNTKARQALWDYLLDRYPQVHPEPLSTTGKEIARELGLSPTSIRANLRHFARCNYVQYNISQLKNQGAILYIHIPPTYWVT